PSPPRRGLSSQERARLEPGVPGERKSQAGAWRSRGSSYGRPPARPASTPRRRSSAMYDAPPNRGSLHVKRIVLLAVCAFALSCARAVDPNTPAPNPGGPTLGRLVDLDFTVAGAARRAGLYVPPSYAADAAARWPLIVFLHGL